MASRCHRPNWAAIFMVIVNLLLWGVIAWSVIRACGC
jgi:hypothetical protein